MASSSVSPTQRKNLVAAHHHLAEARRIGKSMASIKDRKGQWGMITTGKREVTAHKRAARALRGKTK